MNSFTVAKYNIHIEDSYLIPKKEFESYFQEAYHILPSCEVLKNRTYKSLKREWAVHNFLYKLGLWKERTGSVDLNYPNKIELLYNICGVICWIFIK